MLTDLDEQQESVLDTEAERKQMILELCESKAEEFKMIGYDSVSGQDVWNCVSDKYKYVKLGTPLLHKMDNDILSLKVTTLMNWMTLSIYKGAHF